MVRISNPMFSQTASGDLAGAIQFVCGQFVKKKPEKKDFPSEGQEDQRGHFREGAVQWSLVLDIVVKTRWKNFVKKIKKSDVCMEHEYNMSGYNVWMIYWLKYGLDGWPNYPNPPV